MANKIAQTDLWQTPAVLALGKLRQEGHELEVRPHCTARLSQKHKPKQRKPDLVK